MRVVDGLYHWSPTGRGRRCLLTLFFIRHVVECLADAPHCHVALSHREGRLAWPGLMALAPTRCGKLTSLQQGDGKVRFHRLKKCLAIAGAAEHLVAALCEIADETLSTLIQTTDSLHAVLVGPPLRKRGELLANALVLTSDEGHDFLHVNQSLL